MKILSQVLWLFLGGSAVVGEVVTDFSTSCKQFFIQYRNGIPALPTVFPDDGYKQICQKYAGKYEFATLYDTKNKIPVYSAYVYAGLTPCKRKDTWLIEPQLDDPNGDPAMQPSRILPKPPRGNNQALNEDYVNSGFDKGHLYSVFHTNTQSCADSTFTLTNAVPQDPSLNRGQWRILEEHLAQVFSSRCSPNKTYVVTGVVPSTGEQKQLINKRVNMPSHFWTAYCCLDNTNNIITSGGYLAPNSKGIPESMTVHELQQKLSGLYQNRFTVFGRMFQRNPGPRMPERSLSRRKCKSWFC